MRPSGKKRRFTAAELFARYIEEATELENMHIQPTGRRLVARVRGGFPQDYPQGIGGNDKLAYDNAMRHLGYEQDVQTGRWKKPPVGLDEVECDDYPCQYSDPWVWHSLGDHRAP